METLIMAATILCYVLIGLAVTVQIKVMSGAFDTQQSIVSLDKVKAADNIYTKWAAEEHAKAAIANQKAAESSLNAEELRLERIRLEKGA